MLRALCRRRCPQRAVRTLPALEGVGIVSLVAYGSARTPLPLSPVQRGGADIKMTSYPPPQADQAHNGGATLPRNHLLGHGDEVMELRHHVGVEAYAFLWDDSGRERHRVLSVLPGSPVPFQTQLSENKTSKRAPCGRCKLISSPSKSPRPTDRRARKLGMVWSVSARPESLHWTTRCTEAEICHPRRTGHT